MEGRGKYMRDPALPALEEQARRARLGLWREANPVQPWVWRYQCWKKSKC
jgi:endonuclease YncB( thermonuclease family)